MKSFKSIGIIVLLLTSAFGVVVTVNAKPRFLKQLKLQYSTDETSWKHIPGNQVSGFKLKLDPTVDYFYIDVMSIKPSPDIVKGFYPFYLTSYPDGYLEYWDGRGVYEGCGGTWEPVMWSIISKDLPICYLDVDNGDYMIVDGLLYAIY